MTNRATRHTVIAALAFAASTSFGCAAREPGAPTVPQAPASPQNEPPAASQPAVPMTSARVAVTGVLVRRGDEIEICPGRSVGPCPGIRVQGTVDDAWISRADKVAVWRLTGTFDGTTLSLEGPAQPTTLASEPDYKNSCPDLQQVKRGVNPSPEVSQAVERFAQEHRERVAGRFWDRERQTMVVLVTGDPSELKQQMAKRAPGARICVQGQARFSEGELEAARPKADQILRDRGVVWSSSMGDVVGNQILYEADAIDPATLAQLTRETGEAIRVVAFIELLEGDLAQLPGPPSRGDLVLVTSKSRSGGGMSALGQFSVHYDAARRCVYFATPDERVLPVWPFGYWATSSPFAIYDYDGNVVAKEGDTLKLGGGMVDSEHVRAADACGAKQAWIGNL